MKSLQIVAVLLLGCGLASAQQYGVTNIVGLPGVQGYWGDGQPANTAQLDKPLRVTVDSSGNIYIVDYYTFVVRMVTASTGVISTIAGNGTNAWQDGGEPSATLINATSEIGYVQGIAADSSGNVYLADTSNARIRKVDKNQNITTIAGITPPAGGVHASAGDGGLATAAQLWFPSGIVLDSAGNIYFSDYGSATIRKITASGGMISTIAGTGSWGYSGDGGPANKAALASPVSLAIDKAGNLYVGDVGNNNIRKIDTSGNITTIASNVTPESIAIDGSGNIFYVDGITSAVFQILPGGRTVLPIAGNGISGFNQSNIALQTSFDLPGGVAVDSSGKVYVADTGNEIIRELSLLPESLGTVSNAASGVQGGVSPGEIVTVFGAGIGPSTLVQGVVSNGVLPSQIGGAFVAFNGNSAPLVYLSSTVAAAIVPYEVANSSTVNIAIQYQGQDSTTLTVPVVAAAPGIFTANAEGFGQAAALNQDGSLNGAANPAKQGSFVTLYLTGEGQTTPAGVDGKVTGTTAPFPQPVLPVTATIGGQPAVVSYAGGTPTVVAGLMQVNAQIPLGIQTGAAVPVQVTVGGIAAQPGVTIAVQ
jgi:uncharacterized protein (TIGR03437 family)